MFRNANIRSLSVAALLTLLIGCGGAGKKVTTMPEETTAPSEPKINIGVVAALAGGPSQLTTDASNNGLGSFHPDGFKIVFQSDRDGRWQIYQLNRADSSSTHLVTSDANDENPVWMPDSSGVLFVSDRNSQGNEFGRDIYYYDASKGSVAPMTDDPADDWFPTPVAAGSFLFISERGGAAGTPPYLAPNSLYQGYLNGDPPKLVGGQKLDPSSPAEISEGKFLVRTPTAKLGIFTAADSSLEILTPSNYHCGTVSYNAKRNMAAFNIREGETYQLYLFDLATRTLQKMETGDGEVRYPQISPDGKEILYSREVGGYFQLFLIELAQ